MRATPTVPPTVRTSSPQTTKDSFANFQARLGYGANNQLSYGGYTLSPISRNKTQMEYAYRSSWLVRRAVDTIAEDLTREGIEFKATIEPEQITRLQSQMTRKAIWPTICKSLKWSRLYGGGIAVIHIEGQDLATPLNISTIKKGAFIGLHAMDRWMVTPSLQDLVTDDGPEIGTPRYYRVGAGMPIFAGQTIHYSRVLRFTGDDLPYWQSMAENYWGLSVLEPIWDRIIAFDSATMGAAQLMFKAHLRTYKIKDFRNILAEGGEILNAVLKNIDMIRLNQSNEGLTIIDMEDELQYDNYTFGGIADVLIQLGTQVSGALDIPQVRLFGESAAGLNASGDINLRSYYDGLKSTNERDNRHQVYKIANVMFASEFGGPPPEDFDFDFVSLWQLEPSQKADIAEKTTNTVLSAFNAGVVSQKIALQELKQSSENTGIWSNVTEKDIDEADEDPVSGEDLLPPLNDANQTPGGNEITSGSAASSEEPDAERAAQSKSRADGKTRIARTSDAARMLPMIDFNDMPIIIENFKGTQRLGNGWAATLGADYGYFRFTKGHDGDQVDVFVGDNLQSPNVWVIDQVVKATGAFDEHKVMVGFDTLAEAMSAYDASFDGNQPTEVGAVKKLTLDQLRAFLEKRQDGSIDQRNVVSVLPTRR